MSTNLSPISKDKQVIELKEKKGAVQIDDI